VHQTEIHAKLISIMGDRLSVHIETLKVCEHANALFLFFDPDDFNLLKLGD